MRFVAFTKVVALSIGLLSRILLLLWRFLLTHFPPDSCISPDTFGFKHWTPPHWRICALDHSEGNVGADSCTQKCVCHRGTGNVSFGPVKFCISFFLCLFEPISNSVLNANSEAKHLFSSYNCSVGRCGTISWSPSMCKRSNHFQQPLARVQPLSKLKAIQKYTVNCKKISIFHPRRNFHTQEDHYLQNT